MTMTEDTPPAESRAVLAPDNSFLIIGPKNCGKTVFFVAAIDLMQRNGNEGQGLEVEHMTRESKNFVAENLDTMRSSHWPSETQSLGNHFDVKFTRKDLLSDSMARLILSDYPGGAFNAAFGHMDSLDPDFRRQFEDPANKLKNDVLDAAGLFLLFDCATIYEGQRNRELDDCLFNLVEHLKANHKKKKAVRLAVVFTKRDIVPDNSFVPEDELKRLYPDTWLKLKNVGVKYFTISAVKETKVDGDGYRVPKEGYNSTMSMELTAPLSWMLDSTESTVKKRILKAIGNLLDCLLIRQKKTFPNMSGRENKTAGEVSG